MGKYICLKLILVHHYVSLTNFILYFRWVSLSGIGNNNLDKILKQALLFLAPARKAWIWTKKVFSSRDSWTSWCLRMFSLRRQFGLTFEKICWSTEKKVLNWCSLYLENQQKMYTCADCKHTRNLHLNFTKKKNITTTRYTTHLLQSLPCRFFVWLN